MSEHPARPAWHPREWGLLQRWWRWVDESSTVGTRMLVVAAVAFVAWWPFILGFFITFTVATDCLLGCGSNPRPLLGAAIGVVPTVIGAAVVALFPWAAGRPEHCRTTFLVTLVALPLAIVPLVVLG